MDKPLILLTNDDGFQAKGINSLLDMLLSIGEVVMVAPTETRSGMSGAITVHVPLRIKKVKEDNGLTIYKCSGTPVDCVKLGINQILDRKPDLVISGINHGLNSSVSVFYSGTMGATLEGCIAGIPSIGLSLNSYHPDADFGASVKYTRKVIENILSNGLPKGVCLNINFPEGDKVKGVRICRQTAGAWQEKFEKRQDPHGRTYYWLTGHFDDHEPDSEDTDEWAIKNGYVSIVPCQVDMTAYTMMKELNSWNYEI